MHQHGAIQIEYSCKGIKLRLACGLSAELDGYPCKGDLSGNIWVQAERRQMPGQQQLGKWHLVRW